MRVKPCDSHAENGGNHTNTLRKPTYSRVLELRFLLELRATREVASAVLVRMISALTWRECMQLLTFPDRKCWEPELA